MKKRIKKGFTLVELLVVIAILGILATVSVVGYSSFTQKAKDSVAQQELTQIHNYLFAEDIGNDDFSFTDKGIEFAEGKDETVLTAIITAEGSFKGTLTFTEDADGNVTALKYVTADGGKAEVSVK